MQLCSKLALSFDAFNLLEKEYDGNLMLLRNPNPPQQPVRSIYDLEVTQVGVGALYSMNARFSFLLPYITQVVIDATFFLQRPIWNQYVGSLTPGAVQLKSDCIRAYGREIVEKENPKAYGKGA